MAQSLTNYDAALKNIYGPALKNSINNSNAILTEVVHDTENVSGRKCIWAVHSGRSASTGARAEFGTLPTADRQRYIAPEDDLAYLYHTVKVSGQAKHLTQNNAGAFAKALDQEMKGAEKDIKNDLARQMFNAAVTINSVLAYGALAVCFTISSATAIVIDETLNAANNVAAPAGSSVYRLFFVGQIIDSVASATGVVTATFSITSVTPGTNIGTTTNTGVVDGDFLFRSGNFGSGEGNEINGLRFLIGTQDYAGITATSNPVWNSLAVGSSTTGISENLLESAIEKVQTDGDGSTPTLAIAEQSQGRKLANILQSQKRFQSPEITLKGGWKGVEVAGLNLVFDRFCPTADIFVLSPEELAWFVGLDWTWDDDDGKVLYKALDNSDAVEARFKGYVNLQTYTRNAHARVTAAIPTF